MEPNAETAWVVHADLSSPPGQKKPDSHWAHEPMAPYNPGMQPQSLMSLEPIMEYVLVGQMPTWPSSQYSPPAQGVHWLNVEPGCDFVPEGHGAI